MRENARQGYWNGSRPPFGYRVVAADRRGTRTKKKLDVDPLQAEHVHLMFRLVRVGDGDRGPLGTRQLAGYLNERGIRTERAALGAKGRQIETEAAPIQYVAELLGTNADSERAIRWLILMMVLCCDPLAIALTAAASARI
jgi:hypothetical protein